MTTSTKIPGPFVEIEDMHAQDIMTSLTLSVSIEKALAVYICLVRTTDYERGMGMFSNHCTANTLHKVDTRAEDREQANEIFSYWESKFFLAKLSHDFTLTSWREKLLYMCSNRHMGMTEQYMKVIVSLPRITSYEKRSDAIANKYESHVHIGLHPRDIVEFEGLELRFLYKYSHNTLHQKSFVYRLVDIENKVYELTISKVRDSASTMADTMTAASALDALFVISDRVRLNGRERPMPLNNVTHNKFLYKALTNITSIIPM